MATVDELLAVTADAPRSMKAEARDRALLAVATESRAFTTREIARRAGDTSWYAGASVLFRTLHKLGRLRIVSTEGETPYVYEWVSGPDDLEAIRSSDAPPSQRLVSALEAEVNRLRALVGEPPLAAHREAVAS